MLLHTHHDKVDKNPPSQQTWNIAKGHGSTSHLEFQLTFIGYINMTIVEGISEGLWVN